MNNSDIVNYGKIQNDDPCFQLDYTGEQKNDLWIPQEK